MGSLRELGAFPYPAGWESLMIVAVFLEAAIYNIVSFTWSKPIILYFAVDILDVFVKSRIVGADEVASIDLLIVRCGENRPACFETTMTSLLSFPFGGGRLLNILWAFKMLVETVRAR